MLTMPETVAPLTGDTMTTSADGVAEAVGVWVAPVGVAVGVVDVAVGVGVGVPLATVTVTAAVATTPVEFLPATLMVWEPFTTLVESQLKVLGGEEARYLPSM